MQHLMNTKIERLTPKGTSPLMHFPSIAPRLRRTTALGLPIVAAALAFTPGASAATTQPVIYTPVDAPPLQTDISSADAAAPGTLSIIELSGFQYVPTVSLPLSATSRSLVRRRSSRF